MKRARRLLLMVGLLAASCCCLAAAAAGMVYVWPTISKSNIGPFFLPIDAPLGTCCCSVGVLLGATAMAWFSIATSGDAQKRTDQDALFEILTAGYGIRSDIAFEVIDKAGSVWSNIRKRSRPILWRLMMDWPEYSQADLKKDAMAHYGASLPDSETESTDLQPPTSPDYHAAPQPEDITDQPPPQAEPPEYNPLPENPEYPWLGPSSPTLTGSQDD